MYTASVSGNYKLKDEQMRNKVHDCIYIYLWNRCDSVRMNDYIRWIIFEYFYNASMHLDMAD